MSFSDNTISPFEIEDAREAAHKASELQRAIEDQLRQAHRDFADAERQYRLKLTERILYLHAQDGVAWTACGEIARGEKEVADLRFDRDVKKGIVDAVEQQAFRYGADRRDLHGIIDWSKRRDLRIDSEPADWSRQPTHGRGVPPGVNARTGELEPAA